MTAIRCALCLFVFVGLSCVARADIYRWDNGEVIPGTEGIEPGPEVQLDHRELEYAQLGSRDLTEANLAEANLTSAWLAFSTLTNADLSGTNLTNAFLYASTLTNADLSGAVVTGANLTNRTLGGLTHAQLASTASYQAKNLTGIKLSGSLNGWDFSEQNLTGANFTSDDSHFIRGSNLMDARFVGANLTNAILSISYLTNADLSGANLTNANLYASTLTNADLSGANLTNANLQHSTLTQADLSGAVVTETNLSSTGITKEQLYLTASYQQKNLQGIRLSSNDLAGGNFAMQDLSESTFLDASLIETDFTGADLTNVDLCADWSGANLTGADLRGVFCQGSWDQANTKNMVDIHGWINGLALANGEFLVIRDYDGDVRPGLEIDPIAITVGLRMVTTQESELRFHFEADPWDSLISFEPGIPVQVGGTLELTFTDDVDVATQIGRTIRIFDWTGVEPIGAFTVSSLYPWDVSELYISGEVTLLLPGDTNGDQTVDLNDLNNVRNNFGGTGPGDTNGDGTIDLVDLSNVRNFFGISAPQAVPEPASVVIALVAMASVTCVAWSRKKFELGA